MKLPCFDCPGQFTCLSFMNCPAWCAWARERNEEAGKDCDDAD